jgi:hypothetical protein
MTNLTGARALPNRAWISPWLVPPLVVPIAFGMMIAAYAISRVVT